MRKLKKIVNRAFIVSALLALAAGCKSPISGPEVSWSEGDTATLTVRLVIPDYKNHVFPDYEEGGGGTKSLVLTQQPAAKVIDPNTDSIEITIKQTDTDGADLITPNPAVFTFSQDGYWADGYGQIVCIISDVPVGYDRWILVETRDSSDTVLTDGEQTVNIDANMMDNSLRMTLLPAGPDILTVDGDVYSDVSLGYGIMDYYSIDLSALAENTMVNVSLTSDLDDLDLYYWNEWGGMEDLVYELQPPTDEGYMLQSYTYYLGVFANSAGAANTYTLRADTYTPLALGLTETTTADTFSSIASTGTEVFNEDINWPDIQEVDLPFSFTYSGQSYDRVYICSQGYITFWPYENNNLSYNDFGSARFPNNIVSLWLGEHGINVSYVEDTKGIYYETQGASPNRTFIVEYRLVEDNANDPSGLFFSGQIVLFETGSAIELLYDPGSDDMTVVNRKIGLEGEKGDTDCIIDSGTGIPTNNKRYE